MNCIYDSVDRSSGKLEKSCKYCLQLKSDLKLIDIWRNKNHKIKAYTYIPPGSTNQGSRIDYILATDALKEIIYSSEIITAPVPDHKAIVAIFKNVRKKDIGK